MNNINKLTTKIEDTTVLEKTFLAFYNHPEITDIIFSTSKITKPEVERIISIYKNKNISFLIGGATRHESTKKALLSIKNDCDVVLFHDGARPFVSKNLISNIIENARVFGSAIPYTSSTDSLYDKNLKTYINRDDIKKIQTPQGFSYKKIKKAFELSKCDFTDEGKLYQKYIEPIKLVKGEKENIKITTKEDLQNTFRVGVGYDVHKLVENRKFILGGVEIKHNKGLLGHSDADVLTHAIMDSLLGASGLRDIGYYFPDTDNTFKDISSLILLKKVRDLLVENNFEIVNINSTIMLQKPKIANYIPKMIETLSKTLNLNKNQISISVTTTEGLGIIGEEKGVATYSVSSVKKLN